MAGPTKQQLHDEIAGLRSRLAELEAETARLRATEADLRASEQRVEDFAEATGGWLWETDAALRFTFMSRSVEAVTGVPPEWHYGKTRQEIGVPQSVSAAAWAAHMQLLADRAPFRDFTFQRSGPDGVKWMRTGGRPVFDEAGAFAGYRGVALDVTARVEAEQRFARLAAAIEGLSEMFVLWDEHDRLVICNQRFRDINHEIVETTEPGTRFEHHVRAGLAAGLYPGALGREQAWLEERFEQHGRTRGTFEMERQDGRWLLVNEQRLPDGATATISTDITERKRVELALAEKAAILETSFRTIPDGILVLDRELQAIAWNDRMESMVVGDDGVEAGAAAVRRELCRAAGHGSDASGIPVLVPAQAEHQLPDGRWIETRITPMADGGCVAAHRDISESKRLRQKLEIQATTDALTGLFNRRQFYDLAGRELIRASRHQLQVSVLMLDIDHFKSINDTYGHATGDDALRLVAWTCQGHLRQGDLFGRVGGEEFAALLVHTGEPESVAVAEKLRALIAALELATRDGICQMTASIGVATWRGRDESIADLTQRADRALYAAKGQGRDRVCFESDALVA